MSEAPLLAGLRIAAEGIAAAGPETWLQWVETLGTCNATAIQRLIAHCFSLTPQRYATPALNFLLEDERRFVLGSSLGSTTTTARLIAAASSHWSNDELERFEAAVKGYNPTLPGEATDAVQRRKWSRSVRTVKLTLLRALPKNRLNARARRHIEQEERALPHVPLRSRTSGFGPVDSIMSASGSGAPRMKTLSTRSGHCRTRRVGAIPPVSQQAETSNSRGNSRKRHERTLKELPDF